jgi:hypothetical protein
MPATAILARETIENAFIIAMLLTGSIEEAEAYIAESTDCDLLHPACTQRLFHRVILRAVDARPYAGAKLLQQGSSFEVLPWQLGCVLCLPLPQRRCFVLCILVGLPCEVCAWLLHMHCYEVRQNTLAALDRMASLQKTLGIAGLDGIRTEGCEGLTGACSP